MRSSLTVLTFVVAPLVFGSAPLAAQSAPVVDSAALVEQTLAFAKRDIRGDEKLYLDASLGAKAGVHDPAARDRLAARLGAKVGKLEDIGTCHNGACSMPPRTVLVNVSRVTVEGDSAVVEVSFLRPSGFERVPIAYAGATYTSVRHNGRWVVVSGGVTSRS
jgi:hypothetical protein